MSKSPIIRPVGPLRYTMYRSVLVLLSLFTITYSYTQDPSDEDRVKVDFGGALRFNYNNSNWKPNQQKRGGDLGFEVFRLTADVTYRQWELHIDQRFYSAAFGGTFLKYGWGQYNLNDKSHIKVGLIPAYFGTQQFNSNSWFFQLPFYLGFEDDHDMGLSYSYQNAGLQVDVGFYKNAEALSLGDNNPISSSRYSYDFSGSNKEVNQFNLRANYTLGKTAQHRPGLSLQYGGIWNIDIEDIGNHAALGLHYELDFKRWNLKTMFLTYDHRPENAPGESRDLLEMAAYNFPYNTAAKASLYSIGLAYTLPFKKGIVQSLRFYNDYSYMDKAVTSWEDTQMNVLGVLLSMKPVYIYVDYASGLNQPWLSPDPTDALTTGTPANGWQSRFNINIGLYY